MTDAEMLAFLGNQPDNDVNLGMLVSNMSAAGIVPFVGAGMSTPFGFPQWSAFLRDLATRARLTDAIEARIRDGQYEEAAEDLTKALTPIGFQDLVRYHFGDHVLEGKKFTGAIAVIPEISRGPVFTTNFDHVLERVFQNAGSPFDLVVSASAARLADQALQGSNRVLLKLHGDWFDADTRVLTLSQYKQTYGDPDRGIDFELPMPRLLLSLSVRPVLFLGCSLNQDRTVAIFKEVAKKSKPMHFAIVQMPGTQEEYLQRRSYLLNERGIRPIWYPTNQHEKIEAMLRYLAERLPKKAGADNLPISATTFIGREEERGAVRDLLRSHRLLTIAGPPGSGKTRLALEVAKSLRRDYEAVWFVDFAQHGSEDVEKVAPLAFVLQRVATVLKLDKPGQAADVGVLVNHLGNHRYLILLDNCEAFTGAIRDMVVPLIEHCPGLTIVCTSRRLLGWDGVEQIYDLPPLKTPDPNHLPDLQQLAKIDSVQLLIERVRAGSVFRLNDAKARKVSMLCRALEGIPLAIELAAAQLRTLDLDTLLGRLDQRLALLTRQTVTVEERQWASLTEAMNVSYELLDDEQKRLFRRLEVFHRGWTREAAAGIWADRTQNDIVVLRLLGDLHAMSVILIEEEESGAKRYRMLDFIRDYARERLRESGEETAVRTRHAAWFADFSEKAAPELLKKDQAPWLDALVREADNFRAALTWAIEARDAELALRITASLWRMMEIRGYYREGVQRLEQALAMPQGNNVAALRAKTLSGLGMLTYRQGDMETAERYFSECLKLEKRLKNRAGVANALNDLGNVAQMKGDYEKASERYAQCLKLERRAANNRAISVALFNLGSIERSRGLSDAATKLLTESLQRFRADSNLREAAFPLNALALLAIRNRDFDAALKYANESLDIRRDLGDKKGEADTMRTLAALYVRRGEFASSYDKLWQSVTAAHEVNDRLGLAESFELFAEFGAGLGNLTAAVRLYSAADKIRAEIRIPLSPVERADRGAVLQRARGAMSAEEFAAAWSAEAPLDVAAALGTSENLRTNVAGL
jgi:predicted ATPase